MIDCFSLKRHLVTQGCPYKTGQRENGIDVPDRISDKRLISDIASNNL